jgi:hypothetical protein
MALDLNAGKKRAVGMARNLAPFLESVEDKTTTVPSALNQSIDSPSYARKVEEAAASISITSTATPASPVAASPAARNRIKKVSFFVDPKLEERFKKARLRGGFDKLEDAYAEALKVFCDQVDAGKIDNF